MAEKLTGNVALVTGAGVRLGRAIAEALAKNGCDLVLHYNRSSAGVRDVVRTAERLGRRVRILKADFSKHGSALKLAQQAEKAFGRVDILVNSAAIFWPTSLEQLSANELKVFLDINLAAPYTLCAALGRKMKARGKGVVVNIACLSGLKAWKAFVPYSISKAGVVSLTQGMAKMLAPEVRVNAVAPGTVLPPANMSRSALAAIRRKLPLRKIGTAQDVVDAVLYLSTAPFVTGQILCVDGGRSIV